MAPLRFEAGLELLCSEVWLVDLDEARDRIRSQWPLVCKRRLADVILKNHGDLVELARQVDTTLAGQATGQARGA